MTVGDPEHHHDVNSSDQACDSVGSEASTASNQKDSVESAAISRQLDLSSISNYLSQSRSLQTAEIQPDELEVVHQQLAVQALKRGDFKAVAQITAWMAQNQQRKTKLLPPISKEEYEMSSSVDSPMFLAHTKGDGADFPTPIAVPQSAQFVATASAGKEFKTALSNQEALPKEYLSKSKQSAPDKKVNSDIEHVASIAVFESERSAVARGSVDALHESRDSNDKTASVDFRQNFPKDFIDSRPDSETPSPADSGHSAEGAGATSETRKGSLLSFHLVIAATINLANNALVACSVGSASSAAGFKAQAREHSGPGFSCTEHDQTQPSRPATCLCQQQPARRRVLAAHGRTCCATAAAEKEFGPQLRLQPYAPAVGKEDGR
jgi:hypothetical protein